jgi:hypothetical protein
MPKPNMLRGIPVVEKQTKSMSFLDNERALSLNSLKLYINDVLGCLSQPVINVGCILVFIYPITIFENDTIRFVQNAVP